MNAFKQLHRIYNVIIGSDQEVTATQSGPKVGLDVNVLNPGGGLSGTVVYEYNEVLTVPSATETAIVTYTVPVAKTSYLQLVTASGTNIAEYRLKINGTVIAKKYTYFSGDLSADFNLRNESDSNPGILLNAGDIVTITAIHNRGFSGNFNATIIAFEV